MQREVRLYLGKTGSGKTTLMREHLQQITRAVIADADFRELPGVAFQELPSMWEYLDARARQPAGFFRVMYSPRSNEMPLMFDTALEYKNLTLVLEEADRFPPPAECPPYDEVIARGRHHGISIWAASLYPYALPTELRRQATMIVSFRQHEPRDIEWLSKVMGPAAADLPNLGDFEKVVWTPQTGAQKFGALQI